MTALLSYILPLRAFQTGNPSIITGNACAKLRFLLNDAVVTPDRSLLYVTDAVADRLVTVDLNNLNSITSMALPGIPASLAMTSDGAGIFVAINKRESGNLSSAEASLNFGSMVIIVRTGTGRIQSTMPTGSDILHNMAVDSTGHRLYATAGEQSGKLIVIDTGRESVLSRLAIGTNPRDLVIASDGKMVYVTHAGPANSDYVSVVDVTNGLAVKRIALAGISGAISVAPTIFRLYATDGKNLDVINLRSNSLLGTLPYGDVSSLATNGAYIFISTWPTRDSQGTFSALNTATNRIAFSLQIKSGATKSVVSSDGSKAYVLGYNGSIAVIDIESKSVLRTIAVPLAGPTRVQDTAC